MLETWIRPNRRVLALAMITPVVLTALGLSLFAVAGTQASGGGAWMARIGGGLLLTLSALALGTLLWMMRQPRIARAGDELLVYFGLAQPLRVPIDLLECFFIGQAGGMIPDARGQEAEVRTVIVRVADAAKDWHHRDVKAALGHWCEGYITIRGTWCEPITPELMKQLNSRLVQVQRERKQRLAEAAS